MQRPVDFALNPVGDVDCIHRFLHIVAESRPGRFHLLATRAGQALETRAVTESDDDGIHGVVAVILAVLDP